ncbi:MAG TPA: TIM barrel protein [Acidobacteriaceae bacterium]|jgi:sugar phosphate isomerase/epimerase|nr:TIM barrel protein [Acidobacteriaceae bacterium]
MIAESMEAAKRARIAVSSYCFYEYFENTREQPGGKTIDLLEFPEMIADRFHLHHLEILAGHFASTEPSYLKEVNIRLKRAHSSIVNLPLDIPGTSVGGGLSSPNATDREHVIALFRPWLDVAQTVGARSVRCDPGKIDSANLSPTIQSYQTLGAYAKAKNLFVIVENHGGVGSEHPEELVRILQASGASVGALPDFGNWPDQATRERGLRLLFPLARTICHTRDTEGDGSGGLIHFDLGQCVQIAKAAGYKGFYSIEAEAEGDVPANIQHVYDELMKSI